jgi:hypothetical protein
MRIHDIRAWHTITCHTVHEQRRCATQAHMPSIAHATKRTAAPSHSNRSSTVAARSAHRARLRWLWSYTCTACHFHAALAPANRCTIRLMKARHPRSPASPETRLTLPTRTVRPMPRALAAHRACDASPPRPEHCPLPSLHTLPTAPVTPARATAAIGKVAAAAVAAAETCCMHTAQPARDCQGARDKARARATEDARPTVES